MKTYLECIPCFFRQALEAGTLAGADEETKKRIIDDIAAEIPSFSLSRTPPEMGRVIYGIVKKHTGNSDVYAAIKEKSNKLALNAYPRLKEKVRCGRDPLRTAVELAVAGNIIDFGVKNSLNVEAELERILKKEEKTIAKESNSMFQFAQFREDLADSRRILYLGDNAGETVFDRVLLEEVKSQFGEKEIYYAVKGAPVINDALEADARFCGLDRVSEIISSGVKSPGTVLKWTSGDFLKIYINADMVISKGQGNFEALSPPGRDVYFLFMAKCEVIARDIGCRLGDVILTRKQG